MNSDISKRISAFSEPNRNCASVRAISVLPTPVGPRNRKLPIGRAGILEARTRPANRPRQRRDRLVLRDHALVQLFLHAQQLLRLFFLDAK